MNRVTRGSLLCLCILTLWGLAALGGDPPALSTVLYGVSYYSEYMPYDRLEQDVRMMQETGITVVRVGESVWSSWEPSDGEFRLEWMDRIIDRMGKAGIRVILGTPTYSVPPWMYREHPEVMAIPLGQVRTGWYFYGPRQNMDITNPTYRFYCERIIRKIVDHFKDNPAVIGYQIDNETGAYGTAGPSVQAGFVSYLKKKFRSVDSLNRAWGLVYWGQLVGDWDEFPPRDGILNPGYKLEWERYQRKLVTDFLSWQTSIVNEYKRPGQFVEQDFHGGVRTAVDAPDIVRVTDIPAVNIYHPTQDALDGWYAACMGDYVRSLKHSSYLVTETNAQSTGWDSKSQFPPYDGQLRLSAYTHIASGASLVAYWHWHSIHYGQETYWKGLLGHDLEPNRVYREAGRIAAELKRLGPRLAGLQPGNRVAILHSVDSHYGIEFMKMSDRVGYMTIEDQLHRVLYNMNVGVDFVFPESADLERYSVILVPPLYIATDATLSTLAGYVRGGGHLLLTFKSGYCNEFSSVRPVRMPGPLREAAGFTYQEYSTLQHPLALKGDPFQAGPENQVSEWAEMILPAGAKGLAFYDHPFFGKYPAITQNRYGKGTLTYEGTVLTDTLQKRVIGGVLALAGLTGPDQDLPAPVRLRQGIAKSGRALRYYMNFSAESQSFVYPHADGTDLLSGERVLASQQVTLGPWDLMIVEED